MDPVFGQRIDIDGSTRSCTYKSLDELLALVRSSLTGGLPSVQAIFIQIDGHPVTMYMDEEGKLKGLPRNERATRIAHGQIFDGDYIAGPCVIVGDVDDAGSDTSYMGPIPE